MEIEDPTIGISEFQTGRLLPFLAFRRFSAGGFDPRGPRRCQVGPNQLGRVAPPFTRLEQFIR